MKTIGIDTGGTFTDLIESDGQGGERALKLRSTPGDPGAAVRAGLAQLASQGAGGAAEIVHGTTVALNALLTGRVARAGLITDPGFIDLIEIGRQDRPELYALEPRVPPPLVPRERRFELLQRSPLQPGRCEDLGPGPSAAELERLNAALAAAGVESVAVCLLHSYAAPELERRVARALAAPGRSVCCSADLSREPREYERFSTAVVNAAVAPLMGRYLKQLAAALAGQRLWLLQQSGGRLSAAVAAAEPVRVLLSGPAGGAIGARAVARELGLPAALSFDLGGTSTDVAFQHSAPTETGAQGASAAVELPRIAGQPIAVPSLDIHTIGCGGGSLARLAPGGALLVGPESAGADPGPVAYGKGDVPTLTDAHALLGHIGEGGFLAGQVALDLGAVQRAFETLGRALGADPLRTAEAVITAARASMVRALKVMSLERGHDPRQLPLIAFGGGGGLHAAALLEELGAPLAIVPRFPGALSAWGMTRTVAEHQATRPVFADLSACTASQRSAWFAELAEEAAAALSAELPELDPSRLLLVRELWLRYRGQSYELRLPASANPAADFSAAHQRLYGYRLEAAPIELVGLCLRASLPRPEERPLAAVEPRPAPAAARLGPAKAWFQGAWQRAERWDRAQLPAGSQLEGPCRIEEYTATTWVPAGFRAAVGPAGHLQIQRGGL